MDETIEGFNIRLDLFLKEKFPDFSRSEIQCILKKNLLSFKLNNQDILKTSQILKKGDALSFNENLFIKNKKNKIDVYSNPPELNIIYEDDDILVIDKEQGICCHHSPGQESNTIEDALFFRLSSDKREELKESHFGLVHRLDKETSGILLIAKDKDNLENLQSQFKDRKIYKEYSAYALGLVLPKSFSIETGIRRNPENRKKFEVCSLEEGRLSKTDVEVLEYLKDKVSFLKLVLHTGRTHQIRVHLQSIGHPIICDPIYSRKKEEFSSFSMLLEAKVLVFYHPKSKKKMHFEIPLAQRFNSFKEYILDNF